MILADDTEVTWAMDICTEINHGMEEVSGRRLLTSALPHRMIAP